MSFKRKQAHPQRTNGKGKKAISELTVNSQRIGITLKFEAIKNTLFHFISENEIIRMLMYFIETSQVGLEQESAKYGNATKKGRISNKICSNI